MKICLVLALCLTAFKAFAGQVIEGPVVDLKCKLLRSSVPTDVAELQITEVGRIQRDKVPANVPDTFIDGMVEDQFVLREFKLNGFVSIQQGDLLAEKKFVNHTIYGALSFPDIGDGFNRTAAYNDYDEATVYRAFTISQDKVTDEPKFSLYRSGNGFATNSAMDCTGTLPSANIAREGVVRLARYDRHFQCQLAAGKTYPALDFEMNVINLQNSRLTDIVAFKETANSTGWFVHGKGMADHILGKLNEPDTDFLEKRDVSGATPKTRLVSTYFDECGSTDCFMTELDLAYPNETDTEIKGSFRYKEDGPTGFKVKDRSAVTCQLRAL